MLLREGRGIHVRHIGKRQAEVALAAQNSPDDPAVDKMRLALAEDMFGEWVTYQLVRMIDRRHHMGNRI